MPKLKSFNGNKDKFTEWFQHIEMYLVFYKTDDEREKILITCQLMDEGPAAV